MSGSVRIAAAALCLGPLAIGSLAACGASDPPRTLEVCAQPQALAKPVRSPRSQCGPTADFIPINSYQGDIAGAQVREDAVVLVNGDCTGTLIAAAAGPVVLTAGHCVGVGGGEAGGVDSQEGAAGGPPAPRGGPPRASPRA